MSEYDAQVFLNVPFDRPYSKLFHAMVFAVHECGLTARCALEKDDGGDVRLSKILTLIEECRFGIHDLSRTTLDAVNRLPRFNMPLELGLFLGARRFGDRAQRRKSCLIMDRDRYRFQVFCSDISGQDVRAHANDVATAIGAVRHWLQAHLPAGSSLPGPSMVLTRYLSFQRQLPKFCTEVGVRRSEMSFIDYRNLVAEWVAMKT